MDYFNGSPNFDIDDDFVEVNNQTDVGIVDINLKKSSFNQHHLSCLKISNCSSQVLLHLLKKFSNHQIDYLKLISFEHNDDLVEILSMMNIEETDFENFELFTDDFSFLHMMKKGTFTFYKRNITGINQILDSVGNSNTKLEFNLGLNIDSYYETHDESIRNLLNVCKLFLKHKSQIEVLTIDYNSIPDVVLECLIEFIRNNQSLHIFHVPLLLNSRNLILRALASLQTTSNLEMFMTDSLLWDEEIYQYVQKIVENNNNIWYFVGDWECWYIKFIKSDNQTEKVICTRLRENENKRD